MSAATEMWAKKCAEQTIELDRLRIIEKAARRFVQEADEYPRYISVRTWATPEADPYLKLRAALQVSSSTTDSKP